MELVKNVFYYSHSYITWVIFANTFLILMLQFTFFNYSNSQDDTEIESSYDLHRLHVFVILIIYYSE